MAPSGQTFWQADERVNWPTRALNVLTTTALLAGVLAIAFEYGYYTPPLPVLFLRLTQISAGSVFVLEVIGRYLLAENRRQFPRRRWADLALLGFLAAGLVGQWLGGRIAGDDYLSSYRLALTAYIGAQAILRAVRMNMILAHSRIDPARLLLLSFLVFILLGTAALQLPRATPPGSERDFHVLDALFTSTSAMCVTGLVVRNTGTDQTPGTPEALRDVDVADADFTRFGQVVILILIQAGGLGIMLFGTIFAVMMGQQLSLRQGLVMQDMVSSSLGQISRVVKFIFIATFVFEAIGAALLYTMFADFDWPTSTKIFYAVFHSISAFCNAGFSLMPDSLVRYHRYWQVHSVIGPLIVIGGLGFPVLMNLCDMLTSRLSRLFARGPVLATRVHLSLHSKLVMSTSAILVLLGAGLLLLTESPLTARPGDGTRVGSHEQSSSAILMAAERAADPDPHQLRRQDIGPTLANAMFMSITSRTAGFNTVDTEYTSRSLTDSSYLVLVSLMVVGGSPGSPAGGMKTVTLAVLLVLTASAVRRSEYIEAYRRSLPGEIIRRAATIAVCYVGLVLAVTLLLTITESANGFNFMQLLFEATSGCGTVGLSTGITSSLSLAGRGVMILAMFAGRLGPLTLLIAITTHRRATRYQLPEERVVLG